jgi:hypothetical protein
MYNLPVVSKSGEEPVAANGGWRGGGEARADGAHTPVIMA